MRLDVNPFVEISNIAEGVWHMISPGWSPSYMYVVAGSERSLIIDTGYGIGNLKGLIEQIIATPYYVVNTHFHGDHTLGNYQFEKVYIHRKDMERCRNNDLPDTRVRFITPHEGAKVPYKPEDIIKIAPYELVPVEGGFVFELGGGYQIEVIETPGHTFGSICLLDKKRKMLFTGDSMVYTPTFIFSHNDAEYEEATVELYREYLVKLNKRAGEFNGMYAGHSELNLPPSQIEEMIRCCEEIMENNTVGENFQFLGTSCKVHRHGRASIAYSNDRIYKKK